MPSSVRSLGMKKLRLSSSCRRPSPPLLQHRGDTADTREDVHVNVDDLCFIHLPAHHSTYSSCQHKLLFPKTDSQHRGSYWVSQWELLFHVCPVYYSPLSAQEKVEFDHCSSNITPTRTDTSHHSALSSIPPLSPPSRCCNSPEPLLSHLERPVLACHLLIWCFCSLVM